MAGESIPNSLILYHYDFSPYGRRIKWYLTLRKIAHTQANVSSMMPRPLLKDLNVAYRRIPLISHGRDFYCDTPFIIDYLEKTFPPSAEHPSISPTTPEAKILCKTLLRYHSDAGTFGRMAWLLPNEIGALNDERWLKDREDFGLKNFSREARDKARPGNVAHLHELFDMIENVLLVDGRQWAFNTKTPSLGDIEVIWLVHWASTLPNMLEPMFPEKDWPRTWDYIRRFTAEMKKQSQTSGKQPAFAEDDPNAADAIRSLDLLDHITETVDSNDPTGLQKGDQVQLYPTDTGSNHRDQGALVGLTPYEAVVKKQSKGKDIRVHVPRYGFKIQKVAQHANL